MKTYFNYEGQISSKEAAEAIAFPIGLGPFMGFGSGSISGNAITLYPGSPTNIDNPSPYHKDINDRGLARNLSLQGETSIPTFGLINRTGHIWVSTQGQIQIPNIRGTQGAWDEVLVFAVFQNIESPVLNKPTLVAYWNGSSQSFYEYWKRSIDYNYGQSKESSLEPWDSEISFTDLNAKVEAAVSSYKDSKTMVLLGIYGTGTDVNTNNLESFALVPYSGEFPQSIPFNLDYYNRLKSSINSLQDFTKSGLEGYNNVREYIDAKLNALSGDTEEASGIIPIGGIIAWSGQTIPDGWAICDGNQGTPNLSGKFIMGSGNGHSLGDTGGQEEVTLTTNNMPSHKHTFKDYYFAESSKKAKGNWDILNTNSNVGSNDTDYDNDHVMYYKHDTEEAGQSNPTPVSTMPPYAVLIYIMRIR